MLKEIIKYAKEYGFIYPSSEIYNGLQSVYDYGPNGIELKNNLKKLWWKDMVQMYKNIVGIDSSILLNPETWKASGHIENFHDIMIDNKDSKKRYRLDEILENHIKKKVDENEKKNLLKKTNTLIEENKLDELYDIIIKEEIKCPVSRTNNWTKVKEFNLMFSTNFSSSDKLSKVYLRPETAQGIFLNFSNVTKTTGIKLPFGIAQIGKVFRNEIIARQFIFRMKEFEQMEMQFFIKPGNEKKWFNYWKLIRFKWYSSIGIKNNCLKIHKHSKTSHYCNSAVDIEYKFPFGYKEIEGIHSRTDFDLKNHQIFSKKKLEYFDYKISKSYIPYVVETSLGCDRLFLMILCNAFIKENSDKKNSRIYLKLNFSLSPIKFAILPLIKNKDIIKISKSIFNNLKSKFKITYEENKSIGRRYKKQDLIGTPYCITVDYQTIIDNTITLRDRDTTNQIRININNFNSFLSKFIFS